MSDDSKLVIEYLSDERVRIIFANGQSVVITNGDALFIVNVYNTYECVGGVVVKNNNVAVYNHKTGKSC